MEWKRDKTIPYPNIWLKFKTTDSDNNLVNYFIQDLPENRFDEAVEFMEKYFLPEETMMHSKGIQDDPESFQELKKCWYKMLSQRLALVCFKEGSDEIIAVNILTVMNKDYKIPVANGASWKEFIAAAFYIYDQFNIHTNYGADRYITAAGLAIHPKYRQRGVATEMLKARGPIGRAVGIQLTSTIFTSVGSQKAAKYAGFDENFEINFEQLAKVGHVFPNVQGEKTIKIMSKII